MYKMIQMFIFIEILRLQQKLLNGFIKNFNSVGFDKLENDLTVP